MKFRLLDYFQKLSFNVSSKLLYAERKNFPLVLEIDVEGSAGNSAAVCDFLVCHILISFRDEKLKGFFKNFFFAFLVFNNDCHLLFLCL